MACDVSIIAISSLPLLFAVIMGEGGPPSLKGEVNNETENVSSGEEDVKIRHTFHSAPHSATMT